MSDEDLNEYRRKSAEAEAKHQADMAEFRRNQVELERQSAIHQKEPAELMARLNAKLESMNNR